MSVQICVTCGEGFSGDDDDLECDGCLMEKVEQCEEETGHTKTEKSGEHTVCANCRIIL